ncbi:hypothetical protein C7999DRAFT_35025 [Corynascus novoguineensis]|uniref:DUF4246 domain-containing protein n=1 Tax=Corynascus novoguineensis TaxID=1126955 RepID=A0AAN7CPQ4_9PEZI|nr:hypothetical protein C7999DRAFT_35025 [Corynascus novoguineensis]
MASIELTPEEPEFAPGGWHIEEKITDSYLDFRVMTPGLEGRLLAFPNVFQHRVSGFKLADPTEPGHRQCISLSLVNLTTRIISTASVRSQQVNQWAESAFGALGAKWMKLQGDCRPKSPSCLSSVASAEKNLLKCC